MKYSNLEGQRFTRSMAVVVGCLVLISAAVTAPAAAQATAPQKPNASQTASVCEPATLGSPYITVDSWIYPAVLRLYSLGFIDHVFLGMRPWTRASVAHMLEDADDRLQNADEGPLTTEGQEIYKALQSELSPDMSGPCLHYQGHARIESAYTVFRGMSGTPLRDSFHLGSTVINDYGRPYQGGLNNYTGLSGYATAGPFTFYARGEFQGAPSATGYSQALAQTLSSTLDGIPFVNPATNAPYAQDTIPLGPIGTTTNGRVLEAYVSAHVLNHEVSFGKHDAWLGPAQGASFAYSNNAENIYAFQINRVEPLRVPLLSRITGPFRYDFLIGGLQGHTFVPDPGYPANPALPNVINPGNSWVHVEKISFRPTENLEFGFERTVI